MLSDYDDYIDELTYELTDHCDANMMEEIIWEQVEVISPEYVSVVRDRTPCEESEEDLF